MTHNESSRKRCFIVKDITNGKIVKKIEFDASALAPLFDNDMQKIRDNLYEHLQKKFPPYKYQIIEPVDEEKLIENTGVFRMEASSRSLLLVNCLGIIVGAILLFILLLIRSLYSLGLFVVGIIIITKYMITDYSIWKKKGIRLIEIDSYGINLYRGKEKRLERIEASQITDINIFKKVNRRIVTILTGGQVFKAPGVTLFKGSCIRIADDSFNNEQFTFFIEKIKQFKK